MTKKIFLLPMLLAAALMTACEEEGTAERAGEKLDSAAQELRDASKDMGNKVEDACEDLKAKAGAEDTDC